jgi:2-oxopent-4-enoate/cis-2-oxohex-4-enoate hydratase
VARAARAQPAAGAEPDITIADAYAIQLRMMAPRAAGETVIGKKIGVTSKPVQDMLGVYQPDFGQLTWAWSTTRRGVDLGRLIQPKAEAEWPSCSSATSKAPASPPPT